MFRTIGETSTGDGYVNMSFSQPGDWLAYGEDGESFFFTWLLFGDEEVGPGLVLTYTRPGIVVPPSFAHSHASDNWRISLLGDLHMGRDTYHPGEFRFQEGWKTYPDDDNSYGPDGGWEIVMMADRRGTRARRAVPLPEGEDYYEEKILREVAEKYGFGGDVFSDDPSKGAGPSAIASTIGPAEGKRLRMGHLNGSFADSHLWTEVSPSTRAAVTLLGDREGGPVLIFTETKAGGVAMPRARFGTELFRCIVEGSCLVGDQLYNPGDVRIQHANTWCEPVKAKDDCLKEILVFGDRRLLDVETVSEEWPNGLRDIVDKLQMSLNSRNQDQNPIAPLGVPA